jgi:hypothetical protein
MGLIAAGRHAKPAAGPGDKLIASIDFPPIRETPATGGGSGDVSEQ